MMRRFLPLLFACLLFPVTATSRPGNPGEAGKRIQYIELPGYARGVAPLADPGAFATAQTGTTFFGGTVWAADSARWEALEGEYWTFDSGVGSSIVGEATLPPGWVNPHKLAGYHAGMEGWLGFDNSYSEIPYFRRLESSDPRWGSVCVGAAGGLSGSYSYWCGVFPGEADAFCYSSGQGYGNAWFVCIEHPFSYTGGSVSLSFLYRNETEPGFDYSIVYVDTSGLGDDVEAAAYTGTASGSASLSLVPGIELPIVPGAIRIKFCFQSDGAWSDQDGLNPTACGAFAVDNITVSGGGIAHSATFETSNDGWTLSVPAPGRGGDWANLADLFDLPPTLTPCACAQTDSVLLFADDTGGHNRFQDNLAASPWVDLKAAGQVGTPGKIARFDLYAALPLKNYVFVQVNAQWYPELCPSTGKLITAPWTSTGWVWYWGSIPRCTTPDDALGWQIDLSRVIPPGAEQVRFAVGVLSYCRFSADCTGASNSSPWFDNAGFGIYGTPGAPYIGTDSSNRPQDNFPENGTLNLNAPGRVDCNHYSPDVGSSLGDTLVVLGALENAEVYVHFRAMPGPGTNLSAFNGWWNLHADSPYEGGFKVARCDTAERGESGPVIGEWMTAYHESDPNFAGTDRDIDPTDVAPGGGLWRLANDIFPDDLFTMGSRIDFFYTANHVGSGAFQRSPETGTLEMEILPSSATADGSWNCVLLVAHGGYLPFLEGALTNLLGTGSENFESTNWDRFNVNGIGSSVMMSLGRPLETEFGASVVQLLGYDVVLWTTGGYSTWNFLRYDTEALVPWLTLMDFGFHGLYLSGNSIVYNLSISPGSGQRLAEDLAGVTVLPACSSGMYRAANCPTSGAPQDLTPCVDVLPVAGAPLANSGIGRNVGHQAWGNGCPTLADFDVLQVLSPDFGTAVGDERYVSVVKSAQYASVVTDAGPSGIVDYRIVSEGFAVDWRNDAGTPCDETGGISSVTERLREVLDYFGYGSPSNPLCADATAGTGLAGGEAVRPRFTTSLGEFAPNPLVSGAVGRIRFTLARDTRATIGVYDLEGRLVKSVWNGPALEGANEAFWNGTNEAGAKVASGVYFYRLRAGDVDLSRKMVLVRGGGD